MSVPTTTHRSADRALDPALQLSAARRLAAYGEARRRHLTEWNDVVEDARNTGLSWAEIATFLGEPAETVRQRHQREARR